MSHTSGSQRRTHSDFPHLDNDEWQAVIQLTNMLGEDAVLHLLEFPEATQKELLRKYVASSKRSVSVMNSRAAVPERVKIDAIVYHARENESLPQWFVEVDTALFNHAEYILEL